MRCLVVALCLVAVAHGLFGSGGASQKKGGNTNNCLICTYIVAMVEQQSQIHNETVDTTMDRLCSYMPDPMQPPCRDLIATFGPAVIELLDNHETPDRVCNIIKMCDNPQCHLYPLPPPHKVEAIEKVQQRVLPLIKVRPSDDPRETPWGWIIEQINKVFNYHKPLFDLDNDLWPDENVFELRGVGWRGGDCHDDSADIYPGRRATNLPPSVDHNCNGIIGTDDDGTPWEEILCSGTKQYGVAVLGDSVSAHFTIPTQWVSPLDVNKYTFANAVEILEMELDWPQMSATTGFTNSTWESDPPGPVQSLYLQYRERNLCMHRDYQNIAVNGARSSAMSSDIMFSLARNATFDQPLLVSYALVGNDVCNGHPGMGSMTTPAEFESNVMETMNYLEKILPMGSHLTFTGLIDGRIIWDTLANRTYPMGQFRNDVNYAAFWEWLNCLEQNPCRGWMNANETLRDDTTIRANELNAVLANFAANQKNFTKFDITYFPNPLYPVLDLWEKQGGEAWQLFNVAIGMHPNQYANALVAEYLYDLIAANYTYLLPPENPNNAQIRQLFGDQGGYMGSTPTVKP